MERGANMNTLTFAISRTLTLEWDEDSEIVVTELDHRANVDPWTIAATERGAKVRWIRVDPETLTLDPDDLEQKITARTRLVAVGLASNAVGTVNDVAAIADCAHDAGALVAVDAVHAAPHISIDRERLGADVIHLLRLQILRSAPRRNGREARPAGGNERLSARSRARLRPQQAGDRHPKPRGHCRSKRRPRLHRLPRFRHLAARTVRERHADRRGARNRPRRRLPRGAAGIPGVKPYAAPDDVRKTPTIAFRVEGRAPREVCKHALKDGFFIEAGDFYALTPAGKLGITNSGGFVRAGLAPYNIAEEVEGLIDSLERFVKEG
jgi:selenocysteine lyase/cysteine desulfurase